MRIAFYAPLKSPTHAVPSGDRRVARLLIEALERAGHQVELASSFRSLDITGDRRRQAILRAEGVRQAESLTARWRDRGASQRPDLWFTYHLYYKAPDWLGPRVSAELGIPYVIAEASHAPKRANGPWASGHDAVVEAISAAALIFCPAHDDVACIESIAAGQGKVRRLAPFLDPAPYQAAAGARTRLRAELANELRLDASIPWIVVAAMMRPGDKLSSYRLLSQVLGLLTDLPWQLLVAGDGAGRLDVESAFDGETPGRARFLGECGERRMAEIYAACDLSVWPAINEAYGMAMLEAQAAGVPVVSRAVRGVPDVVMHGSSGLLAADDSAKALAHLTRVLLVDERQRLKMGRNAAAFVASERSLDVAAEKLSSALQRVVSQHLPRATGVSQT